MRVTPETVRAERDWVRDRAPVVVSLINDARDRLGRLFETEVDSVTVEAYRGEVDTVFADGEVSVNVAGLVGILRDLDVADDYPGFVVDEVLGRELAATIAGGRPLSLLAQATFHFVDVHVDGDVSERVDTQDGERADDGRVPGSAGADDLDAALAAGFQTRLPGWDWRKRESPFGVARD
ncbi:hypothetical protein [Halorubrum sp. BV1]|uniref:hypothetical protein n=1 Tax=Halorubrum sp. BV1 TaxID=1498500 RepID=UPI0006798D9C|nr:hypothetical protein [Halorubrum sp. BV1]